MRQHGGIPQYFALDVDQYPEQEIRNESRGQPAPAALGQPSVRTQQAAIEIRSTYPSPDVEVGRVQQHPAGLHVERSEFEPAARSEVEPRRNIDDGGDRDEKQVEFGGVLVAAQRHPIDRIEEAGREPIQQACRKIENQQYPDEPYRTAWPGTDGDRLPPECGEADIGMLAKRNGVIGDRYDCERGYRERQAKPKQAMANKDLRRFMCKAWPYEQSGEKEKHRHEEAVGGENDGIEADPRLGIGVTEIGVGNDSMVEHDHQGQEGAGTIERGIARLGLWRCPRLCGRH